MPTTTSQDRSAQSQVGSLIIFLGEQLTFDLGIDEIPDVPYLLMASRRHSHLSEAAHQVGMFHRAFNLPRRSCPSLEGVGRDELRLRTDLLDEEAAEFADAAARRDLVAIADALADVVYVSYGTAITLGIDLDAVLQEVHRSNMSKLDVDGRPILRADGKVLKSSNYHRPDVVTVLTEQIPLPF